MITPFLDDEKKSVDWNGLDILTEWYIKSGVAGIFSICLSSEMFQLTNDERVEIAKRVVQKAAGRVPVIAGATFEGGLQEQAVLMNKMGEHVDAVIIITNQIARMEDTDETWLANAQKLMDLTGDIPLGLYETPVPKARHLTPEMLTWVAKTGRFLFHKDTTLEVPAMLRKLEAVRAVPETPLKFYTAKIQFLKTCLDSGGNGFSGVTPNFYPWMIVWMCEHKHDAEDRRKKMQRFLSVTDRVVAHKYPTSAKFYLAEFYGVPFKPLSRVHDAVMSDQDALALQSMKEQMEEVCKDLGVTPVHPLGQDYASVMESFRSTL